MKPVYGRVWPVAQNRSLRDEVEGLRDCRAMAEAEVRNLENWFIQVTETEDHDAVGVWKQAKARGNALIAKRGLK